MPEAHGIEVKFAPAKENLVYDVLRNPVDVRLSGIPMGRKAGTFLKCI